MAGTYRDSHGLTQKQAAAVHHFIAHGNMSEAYRHAYNAGAMKQNTIGRRAFDLFRLPHVAARVAELREHSEQRASLSLDQAFGVLAELALDEQQQGHVRIHAIDRTSKMRGWDKQATLGDGQVVINLHMGEPPDE